MIEAVDKKKCAYRHLYGINTNTFQTFEIVVLKFYT